MIKKNQFYFVVFIVIVAICCFFYQKEFSRYEWKNRNELGCSQNNKVTDKIAEQLVGKEPLLFENKVITNTIINYDTIYVRNNVVFKNCTFVSQSLKKGLEYPINVEGNNIIFENCKFTAIDKPIKSTCNIFIKNSQNIAFEKCYFDGLFKNQLWVGDDSKHININACYFAPLKLNASQQKNPNCFQLKFSAGQKSNNAPMFINISKSIFEGDGENYYTAIDCYTGCSNLIINQCFFYKVNRITVKTNWRDLGSSNGTCINDKVYARDIIISSCIFDECKNAFYFGNHQESASNIGKSFTKNIIIEGCLFKNLVDKVFTGTDSVSKKGYTSDIKINGCKFYNSIIGKLCFKYINLSNCDLVFDKSMNSNLKQFGVIIPTNNQLDDRIELNISNFNAKIKNNLKIPLIHSGKNVEKIIVNHLNYEGNSEILDFSDTENQTLILNDIISNQYLFNFKGQNYRKIILKDSFFYSDYIIGNAMPIESKNKLPIYIHNTLVDGGKKIVENSDI